MIYGSVAFALFLLVVVALKYLAPRSTACPECGQPRAGDHPLCAGCGWIFDSDEEDDGSDDDEPDEDEYEPAPWES